MVFQYSRFNDLKINVIYGIGYRSQASRNCDIEDTTSRLIKLMFGFIFASSRVFLIKINFNKILHQFHSACSKRNVFYKGLDYIIPKLQQVRCEVLINIWGLALVNNLQMFMKV